MTIMGDNDNLVRLRGLPWSANANDVIGFLDGCEITGNEAGVHLVLAANGRPSGEAFVELASSDDVIKALAKDKHHIGRRYIDVFKARNHEMKASLNPCLAGEYIVRLRGLPFGCSKEEIAHFFTGLPIVPNGITILTDHSGRTNGQAFVQFGTSELVEQALERHKATIGTRYIEVFKSSSKELSLAAPHFSSNYQQNPFYNTFAGNFRGSTPDRSLQGGFARDDYFGMHQQHAFRGHGAGLNRGTRGRGYWDDGFLNFTGHLGGGGDASMGYGATFRPPGGYDRDMPNIRGLSIRGPGGHNSEMMRGGRNSRPFVSGYHNNRNSGAVSQTSNSIHMHGIPYSATEADIAQFFSPLDPVNITIQYNLDGRPSGDADVDFATDDEARMAMKKNRAIMHKRYIELFTKAPEAISRSNRGNFAGADYRARYSGQGAYNNHTGSYY